MIKISYDGKYPNTCSGTLTIEKDGKVIYKEKYCCSSSGSTWFDNEWTEEHIESGELTWKDAKEFSIDIQEAVENELFKYSVCCGGCL